MEEAVEGVEAALGAAAAAAAADYQHVNLS